MSSLRNAATQQTSSSASTVPRDHFLLRAALFLFGFLLHVNIYLPEFLHFRHVTDLIAATLAAVSLIFCLPKLKPKTIIWYYGLTVLILLASLTLQEQRQPNENYNKIIVISYMIFSMWLLRIFLTKNSFHVFCWGILCGFVVSVSILIADATLHLPFSDFGLAPVFDASEEINNLMRGEAGAFTLRLDKAGGIWAHGNEAGPALALAGAAAAWLTKRYKAPLIFQLFVVLYLVSFTFTLNRSGLLAIGIVSVLMLPIRQLDSSAIIRFVGMFLLAASAMFIAYQMGALDSLGDALARRLFEDQNAATNSEDRFATMVTGLELILRYPFGLGTEARFAALNQMSGFRTPHNGFIAIGYDLGLLGALLLVVSTIYVLVKDRKNIFIFFSTIIFVVCLFFEELLLNPIYMMTAGLIVARAAWLWCGEDRRGPVRRVPWRLPPGGRSVSVMSDVALRRIGRQQGAPAPLSENPEAR